MPRPTVMLFVFVLASLLLTAQSPTWAESEKTLTVTGKLLERDGIPLLQLWGDARERGFAHGYLLAEEIVGGADASLRQFLGNQTAMYQSHMLPAAKMAFRLSPQEKAELEGLLAGIEARLPDEKDRTLTSIGRVAGPDDLLVINVFGDIYALACSSVAIWGALTENGKTLVARNFEFPALDLVVAHQHVRVVAPMSADGDAPAAHGYVGIGHPGGIGILTGLNTQGVFAAIHDVHVTPGMKDLVQGNVPRLMAIRRLLERLDARGAVEEATKLCRSWNTLYGSNFMVATPEPGDGLPAGVLEYDTREGDDQGVDLRGPEAPLTFVACTNHHRARGKGTCDRYDRLTGAWAKSDTKTLSAKDLFGVLAGNSFPGVGEGVEAGRLATLHQVVAETGSRRLHVRLAGIGDNIRSAKTVAFDVGNEVDELAKR